MLTKYITQLSDIAFCFMQYVCKMFINCFPIKHNVIYTLHLVLLRQHVEKRSVLIS